eukprot:369581_1
MNIKSKYFNSSATLNAQVPLNGDSLHTHSVKRTLHVDNCTLAIQVSNMDLHHIKSDQSVQVHMFLVDSKTEINVVNKAIHEMRSQTQIETQCRAYILVQIDRKSNTSRIHLSEASQLCRNRNMPSVEVSLKSKQSM